MIDKIVGITTIIRPISPCETEFRSPVEDISKDRINNPLAKELPYN